MKKVCIAGVGAIGGLFAGWLASRVPAGSIELSALSRGATLETLNRRGLRLESGGTTLEVPLRASDDAQALGIQDLVILAVKAPALPSIAPDIAALIGPHTGVLVAMNGVPWWFFDRPDGPAAGLRLQAVIPARWFARPSPRAASSVAWCMPAAVSSSPAGCATAAARD